MKKTLTSYNKISILEAYNIVLILEAYNIVLILEAVVVETLFQKIELAIKNIWSRILRGSFILLVLYTLMYLLAVASFII